MNERFVCVKVDREERPDIDAICMEACQALTGHGGWPLNAFLTPDGVPFYAGTYFPPESRHGLPSWRMVLDGVTEAWSARRDQIQRQGAQMVEALSATAKLEPSLEPITDELVRAALVSLWSTYDRANGGFGARPEVPAGVGDRAAAGARRARDVARDAGGDGPRRYLRPGRRRLCSLLGRRDLDRPPLREDALRQRAADPRVLARLAGVGKRALPSGLLRDARLGDPRDARPRRRLLLGARRRLRGRRGQVLRVERR